MSLISRNRFQRWALLFAVFSWVFILIANSRDFIIKHILGEEIPNPSYAPHNFSYNLEIVLPAILGTLISGLLCLVFCILYLKNQQNDTLFQKTVPFIGIIPSIYLLYRITKLYMYICETGC